MTKSDWLNRQILPGSNRYVYWLKTPLGWLLVAAVGCVLVASTLAPQMWLVFGVLVAMMVLGISWPIIAMCAVSCELKFDKKRCIENETVRVRLLVTNRFWFPIWGLALARGFFVSQNGESDSDVNVALAKIRGASTTEFDWDYVAKKRGIFPTENPVLECGFPFGLWFSRKPVVHAEKLIVWPESYRLGSIPPAMGQDQLVSETFSDRSGTVGDRIGLRPFRHGDSLRLVRWAQTARFGKLIVSEQQAPSRQSITLAILPKSDEDFTLNRESTEDCIRVGASICKEFHSHGYVVRCLMGSTEFFVDARGSSFRQFMDRLASLDLSKEHEAPTIESLADGGFGFVITNSIEEPHRIASQLNYVLISAEPENAADTYNTANRPWIEVKSGIDLKLEFPTQWIKRCHTHWQASV